jgi:hypothetical protein
MEDQVVVLDGEAEQIEEEQKEPTGNQTRFGKQVKPPSFLQHDEIGFFSNSELTYYNDLWTIGELSCRGLSKEILAVGTSSEFNNTVELKPMKYDEAMGRTDWQEWSEAVEAELDIQDTPSMEASASGCSSS